MIYFDSSNANDMTKIKTPTSYTFIARKGDRYNIISCVTYDKLIHDVEAYLESIGYSELELMFTKNHTNGSEEYFFNG